MKNILGMTQNKFRYNIYLIEMIFLLALHWKKYHLFWIWEVVENCTSLNHVKTGNNSVLLPIGISRNFCRFLLMTWDTLLGTEKIIFKRM